MDLSKYVWGFFLILLGTLFLADQFIEGVDVGTIIISFWPLIFVFVGISAMLAKPRNITAGIVFCAIGVLLLISQFTDLDVWRFWPVILIFIGASIIFTGNKAAPRTSDSSDGELVSSAIFWGNEIKNSSTDFKAANLTAVFGGIDLDLSDAQIAEEGAVIEVNATFGGIEIRVPKSAEVVVEGNGIFGAFENKTHKPEHKKGGTLRIRGNAIFAGVEVR